MTSVSLCSGVPVITAADGKEVGRIKNVYFDKISKSFVYFGVSTGDDMALLPVKSRAVKDAAILASADELLPFDEGAVADCAEGLLGMRVYTLAGVFKGGIADAAFSSDGRLVKLVLPACEVSPSAIATIGDVVLIKTSKPKRTKLPRPKEDYPVTIEETAINAYPNIAPDGVGASSAVDGGRAGSAPAVAVDGADATPAGCCFLRGHWRGGRPSRRGAWRRRAAVFARRTQQGARRRGDLCALRPAYAYASHL